MLHRHIDGRDAKSTLPCIWKLEIAQNCLCATSGMAL